MSATEVRLALRVINSIGALVMIGMAIYCIAGGETLVQRRVPVMHLVLVNDSCNQIVYDLYTLYEANPIAWESWDLFAYGSYLAIMVFLEGNYDTFAAKRHNWSRWFAVATANSGQMYVICLLVNLTLDYTLVTLVVLTIFTYAVAFLQEQRKLPRMLFGRTASYRERIDRGTVFAPMVFALFTLAYVWSTIIDSMYTTQTPPAYLQALIYTNLFFTACIWLILGLGVGQSGIFNYDQHKHAFYYIEFAYTAVLLCHKLVFAVILVVGYTVLYQTSSSCT